MTRRDDDGRLSLLERQPPPWAQLRLLAIRPGGHRRYDQAEWAGALVVVERGELKLEAEDGGRWRFGQGAVLPLGVLPLRVLHNPGSELTVLSAVSRRRQADSATDIPAATTIHADPLLLEPPAVAEPGASRFSAFVAGSSSG